MGIEGHRYLMTAPGAPLARASFAAEPAAGEVVVAIAGCGVCHTDLGYYYDGVRTNHALPLVLGHEISGRVAAAGAGAERWVGTAVITPLPPLPASAIDTLRPSAGGTAPGCTSEDTAALLLASDGP